jgi:HEXXH motif-containing protein
MNFEFAETPLWWPGLASQLANKKFVQLDTSLRIDSHSYSTTRFVLGEAHKPRMLMTVDVVQHATIFFPPKIEILPQFLEDALAKHGLHFYSIDEVMHNQCLQVLRAAFEIIRIIPDLFESVLVLAKRIVLLRVEDEAFDISYSSPEIPFSIFISIPCTEVPHCVVRVAEAIIHESMHLQLTLLEEVQPLFKSEGEKYFSPWKGELRASSGVLHALYVFAVIRGWLLKLPLDEVSAEYVRRRVAQIAYEADQLSNFETSTDLTVFGKAVCQRLLHYLRAEDAIW